MSRLLTDAGQELAELAARVAEGERLSRGRRYQRQGNVVDLDVSPGVVTAQVVGSRDQPYAVSIACKPANENERQAAATDPAGAVPRVIDVAFTCICPDWGDPCKHGVAVLLELAGEVDDDASLLFTWRGIDGLVAKPPPGTEPLSVRAASAGPRVQPEVVADVADVRERLRDVLADPAELVPDRDHPRGEAATAGADDPAPALTAFFQGAMPEEVGELVGPLEVTPLDVFRRVRISLERVDAAPVLADAIETIAEHWLSR